MNVLLHQLIINERKELLQLLKTLGTWKIEEMILEADRSYISKRLRQHILRRGIYRYAKEDRLRSGELLQSR